MNVYVSQNGADLGKFDFCASSERRPDFLFLLRFPPFLSGVINYE